MIGRCIRVVRSESSNINPWNLIVDYVSSEISDSASSMCLIDAGIDYYDKLNNQFAPDILVIPNPFQFQKIYPNQYIALVMISFVKMIEQVMIDKQKNK